MPARPNRARATVVRCVFVRQKRRCYDAEAYGSAHVPALCRACAPTVSHGGDTETPVPQGSFTTLDYMFHPGSVAVVGASTQEGPGSFVAAIKEMGFTGALYPVNPKAAEISGLKCYPRLTDIPGDIDHVISSVPLRFVEQLVEDCGEKHAMVSAPLRR